MSDLLVCFSHEDNCRPRPVAVFTDKSHAARYIQLSRGDVNEPSTEQLYLVDLRKNIPENPPLPEFVHRTEVLWRVMEVPSPWLSLHEERGLSEVPGLGYFLTRRYAWKPSMTKYDINRVTLFRSPTFTAREAIISAPSRGEALRTFLQYLAQPSAPGREELKPSPVAS